MTSAIQVSIVLRSFAGLVDGCLFAAKLAPTYTGIVDWLKTADLRVFYCQNGRVDLFGPGREQWSQEARAFFWALPELWEAGD